MAKVRLKSATAGAAALFKCVISMSSVMYDIIAILSGGQTCGQSDVEFGTSMRSGIL